MVDDQVDLRAFINKAIVYNKQLNERFEKLLNLSENIEPGKTIFTLNILAEAELICHQININQSLINDEKNQ